MYSNILESPVLAPVEISVPYSSQEVISDYRLAYQSRQTSLIGRREVLTGKAKFGIFGDGKEVAQLAMARAFQKGDIRSGYYRDQTFMFATGMSNIRGFFSQLYSHTNLQFDPASAGRQMNAHFATRWLNDDGSLKNLTEDYHSSADSSPTASQMPRMVGLAYASKLYRELPELEKYTHLSNRGNEIIFGTIGDASTSEGLFWETLNAIGVLQVPLLMSVWDDNYGISVPIRYQTTKSSISTLLKGFHPEENLPGIEINVVKAWDYPSLCSLYAQVAERVRTNHTPALIHVIEVTQPQGHSTSGSHERYKSKERLAWEQEYDCIAKMRQWIISQKISDDEELTQIEKEDKKLVSQLKADAWSAYLSEIKEEINQVGQIFNGLSTETSSKDEIIQVKSQLDKLAEPMRRDIMVAIRSALTLTANEKTSSRTDLLNWKKQSDELNADRFNSHLYSESQFSALKVEEVKPRFDGEIKIVDGREVLQANFDYILNNDPRVLAFGEDVGFLGDVNQAFAGMQEKYGELRVTDTGIRECTIIGQGIGLAMRGLRPIAEIQYLDYLLYGIQILSDDLATLRYRTKGGQASPLIIRTRGHRLEGVWHSGSPMGMIINSLRGIYVLVPRNMTQAAGFYNTMLKSDDCALIIEALNGYRLKENLPSNIGEYTVPLGVPEVLRTGNDVTLVTYGPNCRLAIDAANILAQFNIDVEIIDVQSLLPFDVHHSIVKSLQKTNRILFLDEDVTGGASAYMLQQVLEVQGGYRYLDSTPKTLTSKDHRPAYASDGDYFSKPNVEQIIQTINEMMHEFNPQSYPIIFG